MMECKVEIFEGEACVKCGNDINDGDAIDINIDYEDAMMKHPIIACMHQKCPKTMGKNSEECPGCHMPNKLFSASCHACGKKFKTTCSKCGETIDRFMSGFSEMACEGKGHNSGD